MTKIKLKPKPKPSPDFERLVRAASPFVNKKEDVLIAHTRLLTRQVVQAERIFLPHKFTIDDTSFLAVIDDRSWFIAIKWTLLSIVVAVVLMIKLPAGLGEFWTKAAMVAGMMPVMLLGVWRWYHAWCREYAHLQCEDLTLKSGWWLDVAARRFEPHLSPRQQVIELGKEDFCVGLHFYRGGSGGHWRANLELLHPRRGPVAHLCAWYFPNCYSNKSKELIVALSDLAQTLAERMDLRCRILNDLNL